MPGTDRGVLVSDPATTRASMGDAFDAWQAFYDRVARVARAVFPTMLEPLVSREELERRVGDREIWEALFERPIGETIERVFDDDVLRGIVLTDALIGTFAAAHDADLRQNRCFLYHVIGNGTGAWDVPVGGMGALTGELARCASAAGAELATNAEVSAIAADGRGASVRIGDRDIACRYVVAGCAPAVLDCAARTTCCASGPRARSSRSTCCCAGCRGCATRPWRLRTRSPGPSTSTRPTRSCETAFEAAVAGDLPSPVPCEIYCHSLTDRSILADSLDAHTLTLFALHTPARLFEGGPRAPKRRSTPRSPL